MRINKNGPVGKHLSDIDIALCELYKIDKVVEKYQRSLRLESREDKIYGHFHNLNERIRKAFPVLAPTLETSDERKEALNFMNEILDICHSVCVETVSKALSQHQTRAVIKKTTINGAQWYETIIEARAKPKTRYYRAIVLGRSMTRAEAEAKARHFEDMKNK